jgi:hypothetical protein
MAYQALTCDMSSFFYLKRSGMGTIFGAYMHVLECTVVILPG